MAKGSSSEMNVKAAAITGAVIGFFWWLFAVPYGYGMMGGAYVPYGMMGYMMGYGYTNLGFLSVVFGAIFGGVGGVIIAAIYNWALKFK